MPRPTTLLHPEGPALPPPGDWQTQQTVPLLKNVARLTAPNPGFMTGPGTNSYLVGDPSTGFIAIDPGPADPEHLQRLWQAAQYPDGRGGHIVSIVCTHSHPDHAPGAWPLQALCQGERPLPPVLGLPSAPTALAHSVFQPDRSLPDGTVLQLGSGAVQHSLRVLHTPGHAANHVCLLLEEDGLLFSGDHILNGSTTVIDPPDGHMGDYLQSLDRLLAACLALQVQYILPAHGHVIPDAPRAIAHLKAHRLQREAKVAAVMRANPQGSLDQWLPLAYDDVDPRVWPVARRSLLAHVEHLQSAGGAMAPGESSTA